MKSTLLSLLLIFSFMIVSLSVAEAAEDLIVAVDKSTLVKLIGGFILAFQAEIWRNQRVLFRSHQALGEELKELKGFCKGKEC